MLNAAPSISVVVPARNEGEWVERTVDGIIATTGRFEVEIIVVDDGSDDGCCDFLRSRPRRGTRLAIGEGRGVTQARNTGAALATGEVLTFLDGHVLPGEGWLGPLVEAVRDSEVAIAGPAISNLCDPASVGYTHTIRRADLITGWAPKQSDEPYDAPVIAGCGQTYRRALFEEIGRFDEANLRWGVEDLEISLRSWLLGYRCVACPSSVIGHLFKSHEVRTFPLSWEEYDANAIRCALTCFSGWRQRAILRAIGKRESFARSMARVVADPGFWLRHTGLRARFRRDDSWYLERFGGLLAEFENELREIAGPEGDDMPKTAVKCVKCGMMNLGVQTRCLSCKTPLPAEGVSHAAAAPSAPPVTTPPANAGTVPLTATAFCANCKAPLGAGLKFCTKCGTRVA